MSDALERGREAHRLRAWRDACDWLSEADRVSALAPEDLELLATAAHLVDREVDKLTALERAHHAYARAGQRRRAARCAFWLGLFLMLRGETGQATAWLARAQRLVDGEAGDCSERGYLLLATAEQQLGASNWGAARSAAASAASIGEGCADADLTACARHLEGRALLPQGRIDSGLALLDEAMLAASGGELSPVLTGMIYCSVIDAYLGVFAYSRAREWTAVLTRWCASQPQMVAFTGTCLAHRAQILQLAGSWQAAMTELRGACERFARGMGQRPHGGAFYEQGEVYRLRGEREAAEEAYENASRTGCEPQPGLALLRMAQGRPDAAVAALRQLVSSTTGGLQRSRFLPAYVEVLLALPELEQARDACEELRMIAETFPTEALGATSAQARAQVQLAEGDAAAALASAKLAWQGWERIEAPYLAARARELMGVACGALGDEDGRTLQLAAARAVFEALGARPDVARLVALEQQAHSASQPHAQPTTSGLTARELEVLRLLATGRTNRAIASDLHVSEKTVERHVSNIFVKLAVPSRAAATAYAYQNKLV